MNEVSRKCYLELKSYQGITTIVEYVRVRRYYSEEDLMIPEHNLV